MIGKLIVLVAYSLNLCLNGASSSPVILALQQGERVISLDTMALNHVSCVRFEGEQPLESGQYLFIQDGRRLFNFLISDTDNQTINFTATLAEGATRQVDIKGSEENNAYMRFYQFLQDQYYRIDKIVSQNTDRQEALKEVERLEATTREYTQFIAERFDGQMLGIIAKNIFTPQCPPSQAIEKYLDNVDFNDRRLLNTSIIPLRLEEYFSQIIPPVADSALIHVDRLLERPMDKEVLSYCAQFLFRRFFASEIMGMEKVAVHLAQKFFLSGLLQWPDAQEALEMEQYVAFNSQCLLGMSAPPLELKDASGQTVALKNIASPYTLLFFFEDGCPVCSDQILQLQRFYESYNGPSIKVVAIYTQNKEEVLQRYTDYFPKDWLTLWDPDFSSDFPHKYNVRGTPRLFLLDSNQKIIGRDLGTETLNKLLEDYNSLMPKKEKATDLTLTQEGGASICLYDVDAPHTILYLYDPACAVCNAVTARLYQLFLEYKDKGLQVFAVYTGSEYTHWRLWLNEAGYDQWINVWDASQTGHITSQYNISQPPTIFLLDKEKNIDVQGCSIEDLATLLKMIYP